MNSQRLLIEKVSNGFILSGKYSETGMDYLEVIEMKEENVLNVGERLLYTIMEYFNVGRCEDEKLKICRVRKEKRKRDGNKKGNIKVFGGSADDSGSNGLLFNGKNSR